MQLEQEAQDFYCNKTGCFLMCFGRGWGTLRGGVMMSDGSRQEGSPVVFFSKAPPEEDRQDCS